MAIESLAKTLNAIKEVTIGDKTYKMSSVTLNDLAAYEVHLKRERVQEILKLDIPKKELYPLVLEINRDGIDPDELTGRLNTLTGIRWLIWKCVSKHDQEISIEAIAESLDINNMTDAIEAVLDIPEEVEGEQGEKKQVGI
jgi:hypothetical protein